MEEKKKSDLIAWDKERGYYSRELTYGSNIGAPVIKLDDVNTWRQISINDVNNQFKTKYEELKNEAEKLIDDYNWNELIYNKTEYSFLPTIGHIYHLYVRDNGKFFLSLIGPESWGMKYIASFKLNSNNKWIKL